MSSLTTFPTELQDSIILYLGPKDTLRLAKTCKALAKVTLPHLYHTIHLTWKATHSPPKQPRIASLLRSIATHPELAAAVKVLKFEATGFTARKEGRLSFPKKAFHVTGEDSSAALRVLSSVKLPDRKKWEDGTKEKDLDAIVALLISQCSNMQRLSLGAYFLNSNSFLPIALQHLAQTSKLQKLEHASLGADMQEYQSDVGFLKINAESVLPIFQLPNLRSAHVLLANTSSKLDSLPKSTALTELRLQRSRVSGSMLPGLLSSTTNLVAFEYDYRSKTGEKIDCQALMDGLKLLQSTLKHLRICVLPFSTDTLLPFEFSVDEYVDGSIGSSLKNFTTLETLEVSLSVLLGRFVSTAAPLSSVLPPNLQVLTIRDDLWDYEDWEWADMEYIKLFYAFLKHERWREVCPKLRTINLRLDQTMDDDWGEDKRDKFMKMCNVKGVKCGIYKLKVDEDEGVNGAHKDKDKRGEVFDAYFG
ncbi:hypothetical protein EJ04DRAFT_173234 [Polyplosphaeria fusca]|uniref:F-box domain-containing protein n=1 Tax=Polyplosphaeria fusca TaxID=682080 RepID=A0A9P4R3Q6_9PLEO|nr:hypothetical protein EJ04DRAFT_173234 [Polyplosphaeria fusca]